MKRYGLSLLLVVLIVSGLGTYYVHGALDRLPGFHLETVEGDAKEAERVTLSGAYVGRYRSEHVEVSLQGSEYKSRESWYESNIAKWRAYTYANEDLRALKKDHRNFMRGKGNPGGFYQDEQWIVYADTRVKQLGAGYSELYIQLDLLDANTGKEKHYNLNVSEQASYANVQDVQRTGDDLHVLVYQMSDSGSNDGLWDYAINLTTGKVIQAKPVQIDVVAGANYENYISVVSDDITSAANSFVILDARTDKVTNINGGSTRQPFSSELYSYEYLTGNLTALARTELTKGWGYNLSLSLKGNYLTYAMLDEDKLAIKRFDLASGLGQPASSVTSFGQLESDQPSKVVASGDRVFVLLIEGKDRVLTIIDPANGKTVYTGKAMYSGAASQAAKQEAKLTLLNLAVNR